MTCERVRAALREQFDQGEVDLGTGAEAHLRTCAACRGYRERLLSVDAALRALPIKEPTPGFAARVARRIDAAPAAGIPWPVTMAAAGVIVLATLAGWFCPLDAAPQTWWPRIAACYADWSGWDWQGMAGQAWAPVAEAVARAGDYLDQAVPWHPAVLWPLAALCVLAILAVDLREARRLQPVDASGVGQLQQKRGI